MQSLDDLVSALLKSSLSLDQHHGAEYIRAYMNAYTQSYDMAANAKYKEANDGYVDLFKLVYMHRQNVCKLIFIFPKYTEDERAKLYLCYSLRLPRDICRTIAQMYLGSIDVKKLLMTVAKTGIKVELCTQESLPETVNKICSSKRRKINKV